MRQIAVAGLFLLCGCSHALQWDVKETLIVEDMLASHYTTQQSRTFSDLVGVADPSVLVSLQLDGIASAQSGAHVNDLIALLPQGLGSLFVPIENEQTSDASAGRHSLTDFEWSMCGGRYKPEWPYIKNMNASSVPNTSSVIPSTIYRHQNHVMCALSPVSSCYSRGQQQPSLSDNEPRVCDNRQVRSHHAGLLRHWGQFVGATNGIGGSVHDIHDHYHSKAQGRPKTTDLSRLWRSPYYRKGSDFDSLSESAFDMSSLTGGSTSGNRLIAAHKRPLGVQSTGKDSTTEGCFHDLSSMERLCTDSLLPILFVWDDMLQLKSTTVAGEEEQLLVKQRSRKDVWFRGYESTNKHSKHSRRSYKDPSVTASILEVAMPNAIFALSTGYHSASVKVSLADDETPRLGIAGKTSNKTLKVHLEVTFVLSTAEELATWSEYTALRASDIAAIATQPHVRILGNALDVKSGKVAALTGSKRLVDTAPQPICQVDAASVQEGEVKGELSIDIKCSGYRSDGAPRTAMVESLVLLPAHTINPLFSSMRYTSTNAGSTAAVTKIQYDPLSTITSAVIRTVVLLNAASLSSNVTLKVPFRFPSLRLDHYPPDMNKAYLLPQVISRVRFQGSPTPLEVFHQKAMSALMGSTDSEAKDDQWSYQRCRTVTSVTLPLPDPGMVFNVLSLSSALLALLIGRGIGSVMRRQF